MLCVIPARGGSKRVPGKNMRLLAGYPLIYWTINAAMEAGLRPIVSSDDQETLEYASNCGAYVIVRPDDLCQDDSSTESCLLHAVDEFGVDPEWVMCLPPTSPLRSAESILQVISHTGDDVGCVMTIHECRDDFWIPHGAHIERLNPGASRRQQERDPVYVENSAIYMVRTKVLRETGSVIGGMVSGVLIPPDEAVDINSETDLAVANALMVQRQQRLPALSLPAV
jgi:CMP-N-acetylneuraminic acid synthetase